MGSFPYRFPRSDFFERSITFFLGFFPHLLMDGWVHERNDRKTRVWPSIRWFRAQEPLIWHFLLEWRIRKIDYSKLDRLFKLVSVFQNLSTGNRICVRSNFSLFQKTGIHPRVGVNNVAVLWAFRFPVSGSEMRKKGRDERVWRKTARTRGVGMGQASDMDVCVKIMSWVTRPRRE